MSANNEQLLPRVTISQDDVETNEEMFEIWRASAAPYFQINPLSDFKNNTLKQSITQINAGKFLYTDVTMSAQEFIRNSKTHSASGDEAPILLETFSSGYNVVRNGDTEFIENGAVSAISLTDPVIASCNDNARNNLFVLPRDWIRENVPNIAITRGHIFVPNSLNERLFKDFMESTKQHLLTAKASEATVISDSLLAMLDVLSLKSHFDPSESIDSSLKYSIRKFIKSNLSNLRLDADYLCQQFFVSRSKLYRLFNDEGGVANIIKQYRLEACFKALHNPINAHKSVAEIALQCGLTNSNYLSRQMRQAYGVTPRNIKDQQHELEWSDKFKVPDNDKAKQVITHMTKWAEFLK